MLSAQAAPSGLTVVRYQLVSSTRFDRTRFDYVYRIVVRNNSTATIAESVATGTSLSPASELLDATVSLGDVAAQSEHVSIDTFTIRHDRQVIFDPARLQWDIVGFAVTGALLPPDPGIAGEATLLGVDGNGNGVRDDLERFILTRHLSSIARNALFEYVRLFQESLDITTTSAAVEVRKRQIANMACLTSFADNSNQDLQAPLLARALNTLPRARRFFEFDGLTAGLYALPNAGIASSLCPSGPFP
jgi:hypothetical protein